MEYAVHSFQEGKTLLLAMKDKGVLQEEEDMLMNVSLVGKVCTKNMELWKKPNYLPYSKENSGQLGPEEVALHPGQVG